MLKTACLGFCRNNKTYDLIPAVSKYLNKEIGEQELLSICKNIRIENWNTQKKIGIDIIPSNDFTMYDRILDATCLVGNIQRRFFWEGGKIPLEIYFTMAHGQQKDKFDVLPLELQNWLNTNYLYFVPEFGYPIEFAYSINKAVVEYIEAKQNGIESRSCIFGPISYLLLGKSKESDIKPLDLLDELLPVYEELFLNYIRIGVKEVQIEEPAFGFDLDRELQSKFAYCYEKLRQYAGNINLHFVSYYSDIHENFDLLLSLPVNSIHIDTYFNNGFIEDFVKKVDGSKKISLGVVNARDLWVNDLNKSIEITSKFCDKIGSENVIVSTNAPLTLCPYSVDLENKLPAELKDKMSFAVEKLKELEIVKKAINKGTDSVKELLKNNNEIVKNYQNINIENNFCLANKKIDRKILKNHTSRFNDIVNKYKIKTPATMLSGENKFYSTEVSTSENWYQIQDKSGLDVVSCSVLDENYDISVFENKSSGIYVLKNNFTPRFGNNYYSQSIIYDYPVLNKNICKNVIANVKKHTNKPIKLSICSPLHFYNFSQINPSLDLNKVQTNLYDEFINIIKNIADDVDILQINEMTFTTNITLKQSKILQQVRCFCFELNNFFESIKDVNCLALYSGYLYLNDIVDEICRLNADILFIESARSGHEILQSFISYKPQNCIGIGVFDTLDNRVATKVEMYNAGKKAFMCFDDDEIILSADGDFYFKKDLKDLKQELKTLIEVAKELRKGDKK